MVNRRSGWTHVRRIVPLLSAMWLVVGAVPGLAQATADRPVTFTKDIAPILQRSWVKEYKYDDTAAPLLPKGTILHTISWFDGTAKNANIIDPRNVTVWGRRSVQNMLGVNNRVFYLTDEQYLEELAKRREHLDLTQGWDTVIGVPAVLTRRRDPRRPLRPPLDSFVGRAFTARP